MEKKVFITFHLFFYKSKLLQSAACNFSLFSVIFEFVEKPKIQLKQKRIQTLVIVSYRQFGVTHRHLVFFSIFFSRKFMIFSFFSIRKTEMQKKRSKILFGKITKKRYDSYLFPITKLYKYL